MQNGEDVEFAEFMELFSDKVRRCLKVRSQPFLEKYNLKVHHLIFLTLLGRHPGISQKALKGYLPYDKSRISMVVSELTLLGLVEDVGKAKSSSLILTEKGTEIFREANEIMMTFKSDAMAGISDEEITFLKSLMCRIDTNLDGIQDGRP